jgi:hypothetical protein
MQKNVIGRARRRTSIRCIVISMGAVRCSESKPHASRRRTVKVLLRFGFQFDKANWSNGVPTREFEIRFAFTEFSFLSALWPFREEISLL